MLYLGTTSANAHTDFEFASALFDSPGSSGVGAFSIRQHGKTPRTTHSLSSPSSLDLRKIAAAASFLTLNGGKR